jgi:hypothetical protein
MRRAHLAKPELTRETQLRDTGTAIQARDEDTIEPSLIKQAQRQLDAVKLLRKHDGGGRQVGSICGWRIRERARQLTKPARPRWQG